MKIRRTAINLLLSFLAGFVALAIAETAMRICGFPREAPESVAYPPNFYHQTDFIGSYDVVKANSFGIRYPEVPLTKGSDRELRIAVIGDSFTEGFGVEEGQRFSSILENQWSRPDRKVLLINCGISGAGPVEYLQIFSSIALKYHPDKLLIALYANDLSDSEWWRMNKARTGVKRWLHDIFPRIYARLRVFHFKLLTREYDPFSKTLEFGHPPRLKYVSSKSADQWMERSFINAALKTGAGRYYSYSLKGKWMRSDSDITDFYQSLEVVGVENEMRWRFMSGIFSKIIDECRRRGIGVAVTYIPHPDQYDPDYQTTSEKWELVNRRPWLAGQTELETRLEKLFIKENVNFLNLTPYFREAVRDNPEPYDFREDEHLNARGHALAASILSDWLKNVVWPGEID